MAVTSIRRSAQESVYTTLVVHHGSTSICYGFTYKLGDPLPNTLAVVASQRHTNMQVNSALIGNCYDDSTNTQWIGIEMAVPVVTPAEVRLHPQLGPYRVTEDDVLAYSHRAFVRLELNGRYVFAYNPNHHAMQWSMTGAQQRVPLPVPLSPGRDDSFRLLVDFPSGPPVFVDPKATLTVVFRMLTGDDRPYIQYGRWSGPRNDKTKAYVVVGREGLDALIAELLGVSPEEMRGGK